MIISDSTVLLSILLFSWLEYIWEFYISVRQLKIYRTNTTIPADLKDMLSDEAFKKARLYGKDKLEFRIIKESYGIILSSYILYNGWFSAAWYTSKNFAEYVNLSPDNEIFTSCVFISIIIFFSFALNMPFIIYGTFFIEGKHGFNNQTIGFFIKDQIKSATLTIIIAMPIVSILVNIIMIGSQMFVIWLWLFTTIATLLLLTIYPSVIAPLFDKFVPLPEGSLRKGIKKLASQLNFSLSQIYLVEGSKRSAHSNAYFSGMFGAKRIVLFDTLIEKYDKDKKITTGCTEKEILGILAHELGHWSCNHIYKNILLTEVNLLLLFTAFGVMFKYPPLYTCLGFAAGTQPILIGLIVVMQLILAPYNSLLSFFATYLSRKYEFEADNFAVSLNFAPELHSALVKLGKDNLDFPIYDKLYTTWYHSHPTLLDRIENLKRKQLKDKHD